jgi:hypothetical protein
MTRLSFALAAAALLAGAPRSMADDSAGPGQKLDRSGKPVGKGWVSVIPQDLAGWKFEPGFWKVENGTLLGVTPGTPEHHYAYTAKEYGDFELHADVKLVGYNSGICIRCKPTSFDDMPGYQVDMGDGYWGCLWDERGRGMVARYDKADADKLVKKNDWNHYYVRAEGPHVQLWLNGVKTVDVFDAEGFGKKPAGALGFQLTHGQGNRTEASFKNVYLRPIHAR